MGEDVMYRLEAVFYQKNEDGSEVHIVVDMETPDLFTTMSTLMNDYYPATLDALNVSRIIEDEHDQDNDKPHSH